MTHQKAPQPNSAIPPSAETADTTSEHANSSESKRIRSALFLFLFTEFVMLIVWIKLSQHLTRSTLHFALLVALGVILGILIMAAFWVLMVYQAPYYAVGIIFTRPFVNIKERFVKIVRPGERHLLIPFLEYVVEIPKTAYQTRISVLNAPTKTIPVNCTLGLTYRINAEKCQNIDDLRYFSPEKWRQHIQITGQDILRKLLIKQTQKQWQKSENLAKLASDFKIQFREKLESWGIELEENGVHILELNPTPAEQRLQHLLEEARINKKALQQRLHFLEETMEHLGLPITTTDLLITALVTLLLERQDKIPPITIQIAPTNPSPSTDEDERQG